MTDVVEKIRLIVEWAPALSLLSGISAVKTPRDRAVAALKLMRYAAGKTATPIDDGLVDRLGAVLETPQGDELLRYVSALVAAMGDADGV